MALILPILQVRPFGKHTTWGALRLPVKKIFRLLWQPLVRTLSILLAQNQERVLEIILGVPIPGFVIIMPALLEKRSLWLTNLFILRPLTTRMV